MQVNIIWGAPASGKSTYVQNNRSSNSITFDFDNIMQSISGLKAHRKNNNLIGYILDFRELIINRLKNENKIDNAWIITTWVTDEFKRSFEGMEVNYILMDATIEECLQRVKDDPDRSEVGEEMQNVITEWFEKFEASIEEKKFDYELCKQKQILTIKSK